MWGAANIPLTAYRTITNHLSVALDGRVIVPEKLVTILRSQYIVPQFGTFKYEKNVGKKEELVSYWICDLNEMLVADIE